MKKSIAITIIGSIIALIALVVILMFAAKGCGNKAVVQETTEESQEVLIEVTEETEESEEITEASEEESKEPEESKPSESQEPTDTGSDSNSNNNSSSDTTPSDSGTTDTGNNGGGQTPEPEQPEVHVHTWVEEVTEATCETGKVITTKCSSCGYVEGTRTEGSGLGHDYYESVWTYPTCSSDGYHNFICNRCGFYGPQSGAMPMLPHTEAWTVVVAADCKGAGSASVDCSVCGMHLRNEMIPITDDHDWVTGTYDYFNETTLEWEVRENTKCSRCGKQQ